MGILNLTEKELIDFLDEHGIQKYRARQIFTWIYRFGKTSFEEMTNLDKSLRQRLSEWFYIHRPRIIGVDKSRDGTMKFLLALYSVIGRIDGRRHGAHATSCTRLNGHMAAQDEQRIDEPTNFRGLGIHNQKTIETVYIPDTKRNTICVSSQIGCAMGCKFCNTGHHGFTRNLTIEEIISQFLVVRDYLGNSSSEERLTNIVFMGMGEPLLNHHNVLRAITNLMWDEETGISRRRITLSTAGIADVLEEIAAELPCRLAISLHAPNDKIRSRIMPINDRYNIESIMRACNKYTHHHEYLKITFEYLLLDGINDSNECARELLNLIRGLNAKVNLLQFNTWEGCSFSPSPQNRVLEFSRILEGAGIEAPIRHRRGEDIMAACGQLKAAKIKEN